ncbi:hypothetical protein EI983_02210 [Roseovarius faecimaris]|uniref:Ribbon-helix-helix protein, CopG family n=1 Tax=Roseovarius faecimaris TaxID=2494550 RepID=A0A6I6IKK5_9RHOB|nr:hypothetical protein [Roseovarius faecimaris]QGX97155.1 hypothetical protein EI983_02210 [Roseovarius faecimaris]
MERMQLKLSVEMLHAAAAIARERDVTLGQMVRDLLAREISRHHNARPPVRADEQLIAPLRARLASDLALSQDWGDLDQRLKAKGYVLRAAGGGLALHRWPQDTRLCKASELGFSYSRLMRRFAAPFPGQAHTWLEEKFLSSKTKGAPEDAPDLQVIDQV